MTVLHIASPFAFTTPVPESRFGNSAGEDRSGQKQHTESAQTDPAGKRVAPVPQGSLVDARDTRSALMRTVDLAGSAMAAGGVSVSVHTVLAAYQQDTSVTAESHGESTD